MYVYPAYRRRGGDGCGHGDHAVVRNDSFITILVLWQSGHAYSVSFVVSSLNCIRVPHRVHCDITLTASGWALLIIMVNVGHLSRGRLAIWRVDGRLHGGRSFGSEVIGSGISGTGDTPPVSGSYAIGVLPHDLRVVALGADVLHELRRLIVLTHPRLTAGTPCHYLTFAVRNH